jgi:phospholipase C
MSTLDRRDFLRSAAGAAALAAFPPSIRRALAIPANNVTGTIQDVQHVVILMQENRSFDHYFGTMPGVRGFADRFTIPLPNGASVWEQSDGSRVVMPYYEDPSKGNGLGAGGPHGWDDSHQAWDNGRMTHWPQYKTQQSMGYLKQSDLSFQFALANAFTLCDAYHCAVHSSTNPNRTMHWTGTVAGTSASSNGGLVSTCGGNNGWDSTDGTPLSDSLTWTTYPERLQQAGVSWKVYVNNPNNYTDNPLAGFLNYRNAYQAVNGTLSNYTSGFPPCVPYVGALMDSSQPLYKGIGNTMPDDLGVYLDALRLDVLGGNLPQVSWVVAPADYSEHPAYVPQQGAWYVQQLFDILTSNPEVWSKTVLIINYDENDGFFDHMPPPDVPSPNGDGSYAGKSTVDTGLDYYNVRSANAPYAMGDGRPYGPGQRVPLMVISPWSAGGWVNSQLFDHTSVLRFLEQRFGVVETNITPWRRAVMGDLSSAFNFATPNAGVPALPLQSQVAAELLYLEQSAQAVVPPPAVADQKLPVQALGIKPSRALPYELHVSANAATGGGQVWLVLSNTGGAGAVFHVYDRLHLDRIPRRYTVEAGKELSDSWNASADAGKYDLWVLGPNGFHRAFQGSLQSGTAMPGPEIRVCYDVAGEALYLSLMNAGGAAVDFGVSANAYRKDGPWSYHVPAQTLVEPRWSLGASGGWYDFTVTAGSGFTRRFAGRLETGRDSISDPAMGNG